MHIGVLRHQLFRPSEPFIADQVRTMRKTDASYLGRVIEGAVPVGADVRLFAEGTMPGLRYIMAGDTADLVQKCRDLGIELLHSHFGVEGMCSSAAARSLGIPAVTTLHGFDVTYTTRALLKSGSPSWLRYAIGRGSFMR